MGKGVLTPTGLVTNSNTSMAPSKTSIRFDRRTVPGDDESLTKNEIMNIVEKISPNSFSLDIEERETLTYTGEKIPCRKIFPSWEIDKNHQLVKSLTQAVQNNGIPTEFGYWEFCTNGVESMGKRKVNTIGFGPGNEELAHTTDEYVELEHLDKACKVYGELIKIIDQE